MIPTESILKEILSEAQVVEKQLQKTLGQLQPDVDDQLYEVLEYGLLNGGKRIRPILVVLASRLCGNAGAEAYELGCAFELLHAATLYHDDLIDNSDTRRGKPSVHKKFGTVAAVLAGDFLHAQSMSTVGRLSGQKGLDIFCRATKGMVDGEFMQLRNAENHNLSELDYYHAIMGKTGLLISAACEVGAVHGGGDEQQILALKEYGNNLGCAFQIIDDLLDYLGDPERTGKSVGNDLVEGKMTLPVILALNAAKDIDRKRMATILADKKLRAESIVEICYLISEYGGFEAARKKAVAAVDHALAALTVFSDPDIRPERSILEGLARYVLVREK